MTTSNSAIDQAVALELSESVRWKSLIERYCPHTVGDSIWRLSRPTGVEDPDQGWKLHVSAILPEACEVFEAIAGLLTSRDVQFKAPKSLRELALLNAGLNFGYPQVGKCFTIYPQNDVEAVAIAGLVHDLTASFTSVVVPFDHRFRKGSSVFARYGAFTFHETEMPNGNRVPAIRNPSGEFVPDDRFVVCPSWVTNPFPQFDDREAESFEGTPLGTEYRIVSAISQRGKGGVYLAFDIRDEKKPRFCVVKEGRRNGEIGFDGQDGYFRVKNERDVLTVLRITMKSVPDVYDSFELNGNFYLVIEHVAGEVFEKRVMRRRRRYSFASIVKLGLEVCDILTCLHAAGLVWGDCKPANLIRSNDGQLRPVDFEGAYRIGEPDPFRWRTKGFTDVKHSDGGAAHDLFSLGALMYFLIAGITYDAQQSVSLRLLRRRIPEGLVILVNDLLESRCTDAETTHARLKKILI